MALRLPAPRPDRAQGHHEHPERGLQRHRPPQRPSHRVEAPMHQLLHPAVERGGVHLLLPVPTMSAPLAVLVGRARARHTAVPRGASWPAESDRSRHRADPGRPQVPRRGHIRSDGRLDTHAAGRAPGPAYRTRLSFPDTRPPPSHHSVGRGRFFMHQASVVSSASRSMPRYSAMA